jgi:hypothetical protein
MASKLTQQQFAKRVNFVILSIMSTTPQASKALNSALLMHGWDQLSLAKACGLHNSVVSLHLSGKRPIRDDHLAAYCTAIDRTEQVQLVAAWIRDTLPESAQAAVLDPGGNRLADDVVEWRPGLDPEQQAMIAWWTTKLATDRELDHIFRAITRKAGFSQ